MDFPVKLIHPRQKPDSEGKRRELTARDQIELERLLRLGWQIKEAEAK